jgi:hypothetical protein
MLYGVALLFAVAIFARVRSRAVRQAVLLILSYTLYATWKPWFALVLLGSTLMNFLFGEWLRRRHSSAILWSGILLNLAVLGAFKYLPAIGSPSLRNFSGGEVKDDPNRKRITIRDAAQDWIEDQKLFVGKDGQGMSRKTITAYSSRMDFFVEFCASASAYLDQIDERCLRDYIKFLQAYDEDYNDRYVYNIFQTLNTFLRANGILAAGPLLAKLSFASKPVKPYSDDELETLFSACDLEEKLIFTFFLNSGCREAEVSFTEYNDLRFKSNVRHIQPKPDRGFRLKGKKNGQKSAKIDLCPSLRG